MCRCATHGAPAIDILWTYILGFLFQENSFNSVAALFNRFGATGTVHFKCPTKCLKNWLHALNDYFHALNDWTTESMQEITNFMP